MSGDAPGDLTPSGPAPAAAGSTTTRRRREPSPHGIPAGRPDTRPSTVPALRRRTAAAIRRQPAGAWLTGVAAALLYTVFSVAQWNRLDTPSWDLGIFTQLAKAYAGVGAPIVPIKGEDFNLLGDHFHPLLVLLGPAYALAPSGLTLLVVQNLLFGLSVAVVARTGMRLLGSAAGLAVGIAYALSWGLQSAVAAQFHEIAFAVPLLALSLEAVLARRVLPAVLWGGLLVFVKEDLGLTVMALGLVLAWRLRTVAGLWLAAWGALWLVLSVRVILPALNTAGQYDYADRIDAGAMLADPAGAVVDLLTGTAKHETLLLLLLAGGILFLRSPLSLILLPTLLWRFASGQEVYWGPEWHYSAVLMPVLFLGLVDGVRSLRASPRRWVRSAALLGVPAAVAACLVLLPGQKFAALAEPETYRQSARWDAAHRMMGLVPEGATVESGVVLMAYLVPETRVYWLGNTNPAPDYLVVDADDWSWGPTRPADAEAHAEQRFPGTDYTPVFDEAGYQLVRLER
ncbi:hypothetical protein C4K88_10660 [Arthrobacter pityocampae]|uniref:DUF2079 domain-containing protein n=1 Tax=Arthrobacter pityocampae TaxID=547334 RepID=A0A2S5IX84_9MICC|nr:DUF2079 domain-containing protein [Arthrobacter pityocampae]PPB49155.1 hypothetical protein C4K88_10660 [Arthrobacter pityocampae]